MMARSLLAASFAFASLPVAAAAAAPVPTPPGFYDLGRAPATMPVRLALTLAYRHQNELDALVRAQSDPRSPAFHHYLSAAQFAAYFAPAEATHAAVVRFLQRAGLSAIATFPNRTVIDASGPSAAVERLFSTEIHRGVQAGNGERYAAVVAPTVPAALADAVVAVSGLDDLIAFEPRYALQSAEPAPWQLLGSPLMGPNGGYGPLAFTQGYDEPIEHGYDGTGRAIANVMAGDIDESDLAAYLQHFGVTPAHALQRIAVDGGHLGRYDIETTLDVEAMSGTSPGAQVYLYSFPEFTNVHAEDAYNQIVSDDLVDAANSSWGGCEAVERGRLGRDFALASNQIFEQGAAEGITFAIATGDDGWRTCVTGHLVNETTADSDPYALAVGGTRLRVDHRGDWVDERGWSGSAGGVSVLFALPDYQSGVPNVVGTGRNIPDVALDAAPATGMAELLKGKWFVVGGTSMSSPLWVGLEAQIDQFEGSRIGFVNPRLYGLLQSSAYPSAFHDIVRGDNGGYRAVAGYDLVTGVGSPDGWGLAQTGL
jgi:kumamolisin